MFCFRTLFLFPFIKMAAFIIVALVVGCALTLIGTTLLVLRCLRRI